MSPLGAPYEIVVPRGCRRALGVLPRAVRGELRFALREIAEAAGVGGLSGLCLRGPSADVVAHNLAPEVWIFYQVSDHDRTVTLVGSAHLTEGTSALGPFSRRPSAPAVARNRPLRRVRGRALARRGEPLAPRRRRR